MASGFGHESENEAWNSGMGGVWQNNILVRAGAIAFISALLIAGIILLALNSHVFLKKPDLVLKAPEGEVVNKPKTPFANLPVSVSTSGAMLADSFFIDVEDGFKIKSPADWHLDISKKTGASVVFLSPETGGVGRELFATFVSVTVGNTGNVPLVKQVEIVKQNIFQAYPDYLIEDDKDFYLEGRSFYLVSGYYTTNGVRMRNRNMITIYNGKGYAVSATGPEELWPNNELFIQLSMNSFGFI